MWPQEKRTRRFGAMITWVTWAATPDGIRITKARDGGGSCGSRPLARSRAAIMPPTRPALALRRSRRHLVRARTSSASSGSEPTRRDAPSERSPVADTLRLSEAALIRLRRRASVERVPVRDENLPAYPGARRGLDHGLR